jgi:hypothetical protein
LLLRAELLALASAHIDDRRARADDEIGCDLKPPQRMVMSTLPEGWQTNPLA